MNFLKKTLNYFVHLIFAVICALKITKNFVLLIDTIDIQTCCDVIFLLHTTNMH